MAFSIIYLTVKKTLRMFVFLLKRTCIAKINGFSEKKCINFVLLLNVNSTHLNDFLSIKNIINILK